MAKCDKIVLGEHTLNTIVAITPKEHETGLMHREWPPPVMSFPYEQASFRKFWMKNTPSPLDIIFCHQNKVIGIYEGKPLSLECVGPNHISDLVVELPKGKAKELNIKVGTNVKLLPTLKTIARKIHRFG